MPYRTIAETGIGASVNFTYPFSDDFERFNGSHFPTGDRHWLDDVQ